MRSSHAITGGLIWAVVLAVAWTGIAAAQEAAPAPAPATPVAPAAAPGEPDEKLKDLWTNFLHYILLARPEAAMSYGKAILDANPDPRQVYYLSVRSDKSGVTLATGRGMTQLTPIVEKISALIVQGARDVRKDTDEIERWIKMLEGTPRQFLMGTERLVNSAEYAVPQLIAAMENPRTSASLRERITTILPRLGKDAVRPLSESLQSKDPYVREVVARTLGKIGYGHAAPYLKEMAERKGMLARIAHVANGALASCAGRKALSKPVAELFYDLADKYYSRAESLGPDSRYETSNVWYWQEGLGLTYKIVPRVIFNEVYAMRAAQAALVHDAKFDPAIPLWIAANIRKESNLLVENARRTAANLPAAKDPTHPDDEPAAAYYALAGSAKYLQAVLARALKENDLAVATGAISALKRTAGTKNLVAVLDDQGGAQPLVAAMGSPSRLVRYMAAEIIAARPAKRFTGWHLVVPVLIESLRQSGTPIAVLADPVLDRRNEIKDLIRTAGGEVVDADNFGKALQAARDGAGADVAFIATDVTGPGFR
ncbi:hypothetical protein LCGC14_1758130, partial [marine sediment metagenome]